LEAWADALESDAGRVSVGELLADLERAAAHA
jgi:hypothetical protein